MQLVKSALRCILQNLGFEIHRISSGKKLPLPESRAFLQLIEHNSAALRKANVSMVHYGCGSRHFGLGWVNVDILEPGEHTDTMYVQADLASRQPFPSDYFSYAFAEDFIEHLSQDESLIYLCEIYRCLRVGGVLRLSFPGLQDVLRRHYLSSDYEGASAGRKIAYTHWAHKHFYCKESIEHVARHIGFSEVIFTDFGISQHELLRGLEHRAEQDDLNIYVELTK